MHDMIWPGLLAAAFAAGLLNAIAGGGSFLTLPALVWAGLPPVAANATSAAVVAPGYLGSTVGFRQELASLPRRILWLDAAVSAVGAVLGALLLLITPARVFAGIVPWLLLFATVLFAVGPRMAAWAQRRQRAAAGAGQGWRWSALLLVAVYGGYFNGGLGILLMAMYLLVGETRLHVVNGLKNLDSLVLSILSVAAFAWAGLIAWRYAVPMMLAATAGGFAGARLARRLPLRVVRAVVIVTGAGMAAVFFMRAG